MNWVFYLHSIDRSKGFSFLPVALFYVGTLCSYEVFCSTGNSTGIESYISIDTCMLCLESKAPSGSDEVPRSPGVETRGFFFSSSLNLRVVFFRALTQAPRTPDVRRRTYALHVPVICIFHALIHGGTKAINVDCWFI